QVVTIEICSSLPRIHGIDGSGAEHRFERADDGEHEYPLPSLRLQEPSEVGKSYRLEHVRWYVHQVRLFIDLVYLTSKRISVRLIEAEPHAQGNRNEDDNHLGRNHSH